MLTPIITLTFPENESIVIDTNLPGASFWLGALLYSGGFPEEMRPSIDALKPLLDIMRQRSGEDEAAYLVRDKVINAVRNKNVGIIKHRALEGGDLNPEECKELEGLRDVLRFISGPYGGLSLANYDLGVYLCLGDPYAKKLDATLRTHEEIGAGKYEPVLEHMAGVLYRLMRDPNACLPGFVDTCEVEAMAGLKVAYPELHAELEGIHA